VAETLVFLPAWNEERNLAPVLEELRRELPDADVLVVDDGSSDATARVAREHGADVVSFGKNRGLRERVRGGDCDVAVGSRFVAGDGYEEYRYRPSADRALGTAVLRRLMELRLDRPFGDATSGMYAANAHAAALLAQPYASDAPEVEGLIRLAEAGLRVEEVPVDMRERQGGESKLAGKKALKVVLTVGATILLGRHVLRALRR
jgi:hypothetical protein